MEHGVLFLYTIFGILAFWSALEEFEHHYRDVIFDWNRGIFDEEKNPQWVNYFITYPNRKFVILFVTVVPLWLPILIIGSVYFIAKKLF